MYGELIPIGGGDPIPLIKKTLLVGRRESCDIVLRFSNVSAHHCQLLCIGGYWYVRDLKSRNGVKINGVRVQEKRLDSGDELAIGKHKYTFKYSPIDLGAIGPPPLEGGAEVPTTFDKPLLERAGLETAAGRRYRESRPAKPPAVDPYHLALMDEGPGQREKGSPDADGAESTPEPPAAQPEPPEPPPEP